MRFEPNAKPWGQKGIPDTFSFNSLPEDVDHIAPYLEAATRRVPVLQKTGVQLFSMAPRASPLMTATCLVKQQEVSGLFCATGFNSIGILSSGGVGKALADWIPG